MRDAWKLVAVVAIGTLLSTGLAACGGGDSTDSTSTRSSGGDATENSTARPPSSSDQGSASFRTPGGDNSIQNFGEEADAAEVEAATAVLAGYMRARAKDEWAKECDYLAKLALAPLEQLASSSPQLKGKGCAGILATLGATTPTSTRVSTMSDGIASLRVEGDRGFALYHGTHGTDYFVQMAKQGDEWKVGALAPNEFP